MSATTSVPGIQDTFYDVRRRTPQERDARREALQEAPEKTFYEDVIKIPGYGSKPSRCQDYFAVGFCKDRGHVMLGQRSCGNRSCPDHWYDWLEDNVVNGVARLAAWRHLQDGAGKRMLHVVMSPDQNQRWSASAVYKKRSEAYEVADRVGIDGGRLYVHPYRTDEDLDHLFETAVESGDWDEKDGKWKLVRDLADDWEEAQDYIEAAPHYHGLVACEDFDVDAIPEDWVAKNIRSLPRFHVDDVESYRPMAKVAWYVGSHSGVAELSEMTDDGKEVLRTKASTTWFGDLHPVAFDPEAELGTETWEKIKKMAERAVTSKPGGVPDEIECHHEDCESVVVSIDQLDRFVEKDDWLKSLAPEQRVRIRGLELWLLEGIDRPPPGRRGTKDGLMRWLEHKGGLAMRDGSPGLSTVPGERGQDRLV